MCAVLVVLPWYFARKVGGGLYTFIFFLLLLAAPIIVSFWLVSSAMSPRKTEKARLPGRPVEHYITFKKEADRAKYRGRNKINMNDFFEMYFDGDVDFNGDCLEIMEYRHDWAHFAFTLNLIKFVLFKFAPDVIMHTRAQGKLVMLEYGSRLTFQTRSRSAITTTEAMTFTASSSGLA